MKEHLKNYSKAMNELIKQEDGSLKSVNYIFTSYRGNEENNFCIINIWPELLHPKFNNTNIIRLENDSLREFSFNKGQVRFEIYANSREELHKLFMYFSKKNYKHIKIIRDSSKSIDEIKYTLSELYESDYCYTPAILSSENIMTIVICTKNLDLFKKDLKELRNTIGYRVSWIGDKLFKYNNYKIID